MDKSTFQNLVNLILSSTDSLVHYHVPHQKASPPQSEKAIQLLEAYRQLLEKTQQFTPEHQDK